MFFISWRQTEESTTSWQQTPKPPRPGLTESTALSENTWINQVYFCWQMCWMNMDQLSHKCPSHLSLSLCLLLLLGILRCCCNTCTSSWHLSVCRLGFLFVGKEMEESLLMKNNQSWNEDKLKSKFQSNSTTGSTCRNLRIWTAACHTWENMYVFRKWSMQQHWTSNQTKPFMHTSWNQAISAAPLCTNRASVCLSVSVSHRTQDCYCWMVLYLFDLCGFHVVLMWHAGDMKIL